MKLDQLYARPGRRGDGHPRDWGCLPFSMLHRSGTNQKLIYYYQIDTLSTYGPPAATACTGRKPERQTCACKCNYDDYSWASTNLLTVVTLNRY
jgi:hypothetical protein